MAVACSAGLALGVRSEHTTNNIERTIHSRGAPCVAIKLPNGTSFPSQGCERLARLLSQTCTLNPKLCKGVARLPTRKALLRAVRAELRRQRQLRHGELGRRRVRAGTPFTRPLRPFSPGSRLPTPASHAPPAHPTPPSAPTPSPPPPSPPPTATGTLNKTKDRARDTGNDVTQTVGAGRPIPPLPDLPKLPLCTPPLC